MIKRLIVLVLVMLLLVVLVLGGAFGYKMMKIKKYYGAFSPPVSSVSTVKAAFNDWQPHLDSVGSLRAINGSDLSAEVTGIVQSIQFESGQDVEAGTPLVHLIDADDIAHLHSLQANAALAEINTARDEKQFKAQAVSRATLDTDLATLASANAQVAEQQALVDKKIIRAPFAGHLGIRQIDIGQYLNAGQAIVTLQQLDPLYVDFNIPEQYLPKITLGQKVVLHVEAHPDDAFEGEITALNSKVDDKTRNIQIRSTFKNSDKKLMPGMFGRVTVDVDQQQHYITLPITAVVFNPYGNTVFLVQEKKADDGTSTLTVQQSVVTTGETRGDQIAILSGVKEGDEVVTSGQVKLRNGVPITVNNDAPPTNDPNPHPHDN